MDITVLTKDGVQDEYSSLSDAYSKSEIYDSISEKYTDEDISEIRVKYDDKDIETVDGRRTIEPGAVKIVHTLAELRAEIGKFGG